MSLYCILSNRIKLLKKARESHYIRLNGIEAGIQQADDPLMLGSESEVNGPIQNALSIYSTNSVGTDMNKAFVVNHSTSNLYKTKGHFFRPVHSILWCHRKPSTLCSYRGTPSSVSALQR